MTSAVRGSHAGVLILVRSTYGWACNTEKNKNTVKRTSPAGLRNLAANLEVGRRFLSLFKMIITSLNSVTLPHFIPNDFVTRPANIYSLPVPNYTPLSAGGQ